MAKKKKQNKWKSYGQVAEPLTGRKESAFFDVDLTPHRLEDEEYVKELKKKL